jgi:hypothetical protein
MAAEDFESGAVKQHPLTKAVAVRTAYPDMEMFQDRQWGVMTLNNGGHYATYDDVAEWPNMVPAENPPADPEPEVEQ